MIVVNAARLPHALLSMRLFRALDDWIRAADGRGLLTVPIDVGVDDYNVYAPDLLWYRAARAPALDAVWPYPLPDLAIEIRSPSTWRSTSGRRRASTSARPCPSCGSSTAMPSVLLVFRRSAPTSPTFDVALEFDRAATLTSPLLPGFALGIRALFDLS